VDGIDAMDGMDSARQKRKRDGHEPDRVFQNGAGEETRTLDVHLGKVVLYQLSYARKTGCKK
jgi:hypothetical protein